MNPEVVRVISKLRNKLSLEEIFDYMIKGESGDDYHITEVLGDSGYISKEESYVLQGYVESTSVKDLLGLYLLLEMERAK